MSNPTRKGNLTRDRILDVALTLFRTHGYDATTMREIAANAKVATGAAYRHFPSKEFIVMAFYRRTFEGMLPKVRILLESPGPLEDRIRALIRLKMKHFGPNRAVLRAILRNGADPNHPVSPFSEESKSLRDLEIGWFRQLLAGENVRLPAELEAHVPEVLWALHIGVIFFWIADDSFRQSHTLRLIDQGMNTITALLRLSPLRKLEEAS